MKSTLPFLLTLACFWLLCCAKDRSQEEAERHAKEYERFTRLTREGEAALSTRNDQAALECFEEASKIVENNTDVISGLAETYERLGRRSDSIRQYRILAKYEDGWPSGGRTSMLLKYGELCILDNRIEEAKRVFRCAGTRCSTWYIEPLNLPAVGGKLNDYRAAAYLAIATDDYHPPIQERLALTRKAVHFAPQWENAKVFLGRTLLELPSGENEAEALFSKLRDSKLDDIRRAAEEGLSAIRQRHLKPLGTTHYSDFWRVTVGVLVRKDE